MGTSVVKEEARGVARVEHPTPRDAHQRQLFLPFLAAADPKKRPQGDNASPEGSISKERRLGWKAKSLMAAGGDVKFPADE